MSQQGKLSEPTSDLDTLTGNVGGAVAPDPLGNIDILGSSPFTVTGNPGAFRLTLSASLTDGQLIIGSTASGAAAATLSSTDSSITITNGSNSIDLAVNVLAGDYPVTPFVVGVVGQAGYQTIQSALDAANAAGGGIVVVQPGTYVENLTLYDSCHIMGLTFADAGGGVVIQGVHTPPNTGGFAFNNVQLQSATHIFNSAAAGSAHLIIGNAAIIVTNGYTFNLPNWTGKLETYDVNDRGSTDDGYINNSGGSEVAIFSSAIGAGTGNTMNISGSSSIFSCAVSCPVNFVTGSSAFNEYNVHTGTITLSNNSTGEFIGCEIDSQITMSSSAAWNIADCVINTASNPSIDGAGGGTLTLGDITFLNNSSLNAALTLGSSTFYPQAMSDGQLLIGDTSDAPTAGVLTSTGSTLAITNGAGTINLETGSAVSTSFVTDSGTATPTSGVLTISSGVGCDTSGSGSTVTIDAIGGGLDWSVETGTTRTMTINTGNIGNNAAGVTFTLPDTAAVGSILRVTALQASWTIAQNAGETIYFGSDSTTTGVGGSIASTNARDAVELVCVVANTDWQVISSVGNINIV